MRSMFLTGAFLTIFLLLGCNGDGAAIEGSELFGKPIKEGKFRDEVGDQVAEFYWHRNEPFYVNHKSGRSTERVKNSAAYFKDWGIIKNIDIRSVKDGWRRGSKVINVNFTQLGEKYHRRILGRDQNWAFGIIIGTGEISEVDRGVGNTVYFDYEVTLNEVVEKQPNNNKNKSGTTYTFPARVTVGQNADSGKYEVKLFELGYGSEGDINYREASYNYMTVDGERVIMNSTFRGDLGER